MVDSWDRFLGPFISPSDTLAQWVMAILTLVAAVLLFQTLRQTNKTNEAAVRAADAALEANEIMRTESRPWLDIGVVPAGALVYMPDSNTIAFPCRIIVKNMGKSPAFNVAIDIGLSAVLDNGNGLLGGDDQIQLNERLVENARRRSVKNNFTNTIFPDHPYEINNLLAHANFIRDGVSEGQKFGLLFALVVAYGPRHKPAYTTLLSCPIVRSGGAGLYGFTVDDIKAGRSKVTMHMIEGAKLF